MNFFDKLLELYSEIKFPKEYEEIAKVDKTITWYFADSSKQFISCKSDESNFIIEFDTRNAYATIINNMFDLNSKFVKEMNSITEKKARNIFIAINLKNTDELKQINMICKIITMGLLFESGENLLLELKKDGAVVLCNTETAQKLWNLTETIQEPCGKFSEFILESKFNFHLDYHERYVRSNRTSYFWKNKDLIIKGTYKYLPKKIHNFILDIFNGNQLDYKNIQQVYSENYFNIVVLNNLQDILKEYYLCSNEKYLDSNGKYNNNYKDLEPKNYLKTFLYPIILSTKI